jgi:hypothetical protein
MGIDTAAELGGVREIAGSEVAHYREHGWAKLDQVVPKDFVARLLDVAVENMGQNAGNERFNIRGSRYAAWPRAARESAWLRAVSQSRELGSVARALCGGRELRWYTDIFMAKRPARDGGSRTPWHQDLPHQPFDRGGAITLWIPLVDCPPEKGSLRFLGGSVKAGPLGRFGMRKDGIDIVDYYPQVLEQYPVSPPLTLEVGDATVHDFLTVHSAPDNLTDSTRWVYAVTYFPAETLYNGAASNNTKGIELTVDELFDDDNFPVIPA